MGSIDDLFRKSAIGFFFFQLINTQTHTNTHACVFSLTNATICDQSVFLLSTAITTEPQKLHTKIVFFAYLHFIANKWMPRQAVRYICLNVRQWCSYNLCHRKWIDRSAIHCTAHIIKMSVYWRQFFFCSQSAYKNQCCARLHSKSLPQLQLLYA